MNTGWRYRIVKKEGKYGFHPVFIDENGDIVNINDMPEVCEDNLQELAKKIAEAWHHAIINYDKGEEIEEAN
jgi:hypothetical protein